MRFIKEFLHSEEGIVDDKVNKKYEKALEKREEKAQKERRFLHPFMKKLARNPTVIFLKKIKAWDM